MLDELLNSMDMRDLWCVCLCRVPAAADQSGAAGSKSAGPCHQ